MRRIYNSFLGAGLAGLISLGLGGCETKERKEEPYKQSVNDGEIYRKGLPDGYKISQRGYEDLMDIVGLKTGAIDGEVEKDGRLTMFYCGNYNRIGSLFAYPELAQRILKEVDKNRNKSITDDEIRPYRDKAIREDN